MSNSSSTSTAGTRKRGARGKRLSSRSNPQTNESAENPSSSSPGEAGKSSMSDFMTSQGFHTNTNEDCVFEFVFGGINIHPVGVICRPHGWTGTIFTDA